MKRTPLRALATQLARLRDAVEQKVFREPDLYALVRGWEIHHRPFHRTFRDPRWNLVSECPACAGTGEVDEQHCSGCRGVGTIRHDQVSGRCGS